MWLRQLVKNRLLVGVRHLVAALEQGGNRYAEECGDLQQSATADAIGAFLIFLDLLERQIELIGQFGLREPLLQTINPDIAANDLVDLVGPFASHQKLPNNENLQDNFPVQLPGRHVTALLPEGSWQPATTTQAFSVPFVTR